MLPPATRPPYEYVIGPSDVLAVKVWKEDELQRDDLIVTPDGLIDFLQQNSVPGSSSTGLNSIEDIQAFAEAAQADPSILVVPQTLIDAYTGTIDNIDTENINVDELFNQLLGGLEIGGEES